MNSKWCNAKINMFVKDYIQINFCHDVYTVLKFQTKSMLAKVGSRPAKIIIQVSKF